MAGVGPGAGPGSESGLGFEVGLGLEFGSGSGPGSGSRSWAEWAKGAGEGKARRWVGWRGSAVGWWRWSRREKRKKQQQP